MCIRDRTGTVLAQYAEAGELAAPGTPLFKVADMEQIYLRAYITSEPVSYTHLKEIIRLTKELPHCLPCRDKNGKRIECFHTVYLSLIHI